MKARHLQDTVKHRNGVDMPWLGIGVFQVQEGSELVKALRSAVKLGYRSIDTAATIKTRPASGRGSAKRSRKPDWQEKACS